MIYNVSLTVVVLLAAGCVWGYRSGWFTSHKPMLEPGDSFVVDQNLPATVQEAPRVYALKNAAFICNLSGHHQAKMAKYLTNALAAFGSTRPVDVLVLQPGGGFASITNGPVEMTPAAVAAACESVAKTPDADQTSVKTALNRAMDEDATDIYFLTDTTAAAEFPGDPLAAYKALTGDRMTRTNIIIFSSPSDVPADVEKLKAVSRVTHGEPQKG